MIRTSLSTGGAIGAAAATSIIILVVLADAGELVAHLQNRPADNEMGA